MIHRIEQLLANNEAFIAEHLSLDPGYFDKLAEGQRPEFLWIGCSDSRVAPNLITGSDAGDMFVHRNIANLVVQTDMNLLSVLQYAVEVLQVNHVIVCGHYGCGGVKAALGDERHGLIDNWLRLLKDTRDFFWPELEPLGEDARLRRMVELNVVEQVNNLGKTSVVQAAWQRGSRPWIHGWVFELNSGKLKPLTSMINDNERMREVCKFQRVRAAGGRLAGAGAPA